MKKLNNKAFTLIELLAVIVILALLVAVAVPSVTKYLQTARKGVFSVNANTAIEAVKDDVGYSAITTDKIYSLSDINALLDTKLTQSPFGINYMDSSFVKVTFDENGNPNYSICLLDIQGNGFYDNTTKSIDSNEVKDDNVKLGLTGVSCN